MTTRRGGIVLCGGKSSRMGEAKAWLAFGAETMLARVVRLVREAVDFVVVVAAPVQEIPPLPAEILIARDEFEHRGPLQGLVAGLEALPDTVEAAFVSSCDVPFLQPAWIGRLFELLDGHAICVPEIHGHVQPLSAVYHREVLPTAKRLLVGEKVGPRKLLSLLNTKTVRESEMEAIDPTLESVRNINTPEEYQAALRFLANVNALRRDRELDRANPSVGDEA